MEIVIEIHAHALGRNATEAHLGAYTLARLVNQREVASLVCLAATVMCQLSLKRNIWLRESLSRALKDGLLTDSTAHDRIFRQALGALTAIEAHS